MSATEEKYLNKLPGIIEIVQDPGTLTAILDDFSNVEAVQTEIDLLTFLRLSSITDLNVNDDFSDVLKVETDDNGIIYSSVNEQVTVTGNYYEIGDPDVLAEMLGKNVIDVTGVQHVGSKIGSKGMPSLIVRITSALPGGKTKQVYVRDATFIGQVVNGFLDANRAGDLPNSPFEFSGNKGGDIFTFTDDLPA